ncbi:tetratricopeptide repeat protein [Brevundimonas sp.]|uniref:tetratricopeptide repeat protein n=2 Tax=unclassified Brevundimonas TaxID=2622653 RepID=UPI0028998013|nr:tetratricopeptide repeat protein [Brevundimonas sp.]
MKGPPMRFPFRRSALFAAASLIALGLATPSLAQETPPADAAPVQVEPGVEAEPSPEADPATPDTEGQDPEVIIAEAPTTPEAPPIPAVWAPIPTDAEGGSAYGYYLAGRNALTSGESETGADYLARVEALTPEQPRVREQAFTASLLAGDLDVAARIAPEGEEVTPVIVQAGRLVAAVQTFVHGDARRADALLKTAPIGPPHDRAGLYLHPWIAAAAGDWERALAAPPAGLDPVSTLVARANRARLLELRRRYDEADAEWRDLTSHALASRLFRLPYGEFLERRRKRDEALVQYDAAVAAGATDRATMSARARVLAKGRPPAAPTWRQGAALALKTAADQAIAQRALEFGVVYLRLALNLDPTDENRFLIGQTLQQAELEPAARAALAQVGRQDIELYAAARVQSALSFEKDGQAEQALAELNRAVEARPNEASIAYLLAGQLVQMSRFQEAVTVLNGPLLATADQGFEVNFLRGAAYEALDRKPEAEAELWAALQKQPNNPTVLNYLGYLWVDSGTRVEQGAEMIARAFAADPSDGNIQDSLGWAQYRRGQFDVAVETLEQAVAKEPANAEINDHLGDAYWAVGRQREAGFQWNRVLTLDVEAERKAEVEAKLRDKLGQAPTDDTGAGAAD